MTTEKRPLARAGIWAAAILAVAVLAGAGAKAGGSRLDAIEVSDGGETIKISVKASGPFQYRRVNVDELRIAVDLEGLAIGGNIDRSLGAGVVKKVRAAQNTIDPPVTRVVIELSSPARYRLAQLSPRALDIEVFKPMSNGKNATPNEHDGGGHDKPPAAAGPIPAIDLHCDTITKLYKTGSPAGIKGRSLEVTLPRLEEGAVAGQFFAIWIEPARRPQARQYADQVIDFFEEMLAENSGRIAFAGSAADFERNRKAGKISAFLAIEGGEAISTLDDIDHFHSRGVRYVTITWNSQTKMADAAKDRNKSYGGLSPFGEQAVRRMNEVGMIVDLSHSSDDTVRDALRVSKDPVFASHSCAYALHAHYRNLRDDLVKGICDGGGVIGVNFYSSFLNGSRTAYLSTVADHVDHIASVGGVECVALGSDYDGSITTPRGLEHSGKMQGLAEVLRKRGYSEEDIRRIYSGNVLRVVADVADK